MGKEFVVNSLEEMCDLMCGGVEEDEEMYECFHCCTKSVVWQSDFNFEDMGYEGEGIVHICHCTNCGAEIEYRVPCGNEEDEDETNRAE